MSLCDVEDDDKHHPWLVNLKPDLNYMLTYKLDKITWHAPTSDCPGL